MNSNPGSTDEKAMRIAYLIAGFIQQTLSPEEHEELDAWVTESDENMELFEELTDEENIAAGLQKMRERDSGVAFEKLKERLPFPKEKRRFRIWPYAVAASVVLAAAGLWFFRPGAPAAPEHPAIAAQAAADLQPGGDKAVLTLSNGQTIVLQDRSAGVPEKEGAATITRPASGQLVYQGTNGPAPAEEYNTLTTPRGGQYRITLSDGTRVWLNAASALRYPVVFTGASRVVELRGEAYLEVAHDAGHPFYVRSGGQEIKVLGTRFNVNAYTDNGAYTATLVEGRIQLTAAGRREILAPGQQALVTGGNIRVSQADTASVLAWKEGLFRFRNATIQEVMKEVGRWYDARIVYEGAISKHFNGEIARSLPASKVLNLLQKTGSVQFRVSGNTITVTP